MKTSLRCMEVCKAITEIGNRRSVSDANAGIGALAARSGVMGAYLNVKINSAGVEDKKWMADILTRGGEIQERAIALEGKIMEIVESNL